MSSGAPSTPEAPRRAPGGVRGENGDDLPSDGPCCSGHAEEAGHSHHSHPDHSPPPDAIKLGGLVSVAAGMGTGPSPVKTVFSRFLSAQEAETLAATEPSGPSSSSSSSTTTSSSSSSSGPASKREDYLPWDDYFMAVAFLSSMRSKDPSTQVGACIVDPDQRIVGIGYNGFPRGCSDDALPWARTAENDLDTKYPFVCHAEMNAIVNSISLNLKGCRLYVALFPCNECAKLIIQVGIKNIIFLSDKYHDSPPFIASRRLLDLAGVQYQQHVPSRKEITIKFEL